MAVEQTFCSQMRGACRDVPVLGHRPLGREWLPGSDPLRPDRILRILRYRSEPVEALAKVTDEAMRLTESLRCHRRLAAAKHFPPSFEMLVVALDLLLLGLSREVLNFWEYFSQGRRVGGGSIGLHRVRCHPGILESGAKESGSGFGVTGKCYAWAGRPQKAMKVL
jgi:hypothetical protein